jgi:ribosomal protein L11 methyltransferase
MSVFDLGTGSGILAIAAVKLGAASVLAVDIDSVAVSAAKKNLFINNVSDFIHIRRGSLSLRMQRVNKNAFDLVLANITSRTISDLAGALFQVLKPGGKLVVSGIHPQGLDEVLIRLVMAGLKLQKVDNANEWYAVIALKPELAVIVN